MQSIIASYFTENLDFKRALSEVVSPENDVDGTIHNICLGIYDEVSRKALTCEPCQLVIKALTNKTTELHRPTTSPNRTQIYLDSVQARFYFDRATASFDNPNGAALEETSSESSKQVNV